MERRRALTGSRGTGKTSKRTARILHGVGRVKSEEFCSSFSRILLTRSAGSWPTSTAFERSQMPLVQIKDLPDNARTWVFGADRDLDEGATDLLLREVDRFLSQWHAHGSPLTT